VNVLESWVFAMWILYADGEANMFVPPGTPTVIAHFATEAECQELVDRVVAKSKELNKNQKDTAIKIADIDGKCFQIQEAGTRM